MHTKICTQQQQQKKPREMIGCSRDGNGEESGMYYKVIRGTSGLPCLEHHSVVESAPWDIGEQRGRKPGGGQQCGPPGTPGGRTV